MSRFVVISLIVFAALAACTVISLVITAMNAEAQNRRQFGTSQTYRTTGGQQMQPNWK